MPIRAVEDRRLYRQIADQIATLIASGEFLRGHRLPSERDLAAQLRVSRPSVREALIALEMEGLVRVQIGAGIFVTNHRQPVLEPIDGGRGPLELLRARWLIEGEVAAAAARKATPAELGRMRSSLEAMERMVDDIGEFRAAERDFHVHIAAGTHNGALVSVVRHLWNDVGGAVWRRMDEAFRNTVTPSLRDHRTILAALEARDAPRSRNAMRTSIERVIHAAEEVA